MDTVEEAYEALGKRALDFIHNRAWDKVVCEAKIYNQMVSLSYWLEDAGVKNEKSVGFSLSPSESASACLYLRDDLIKSNGNRIWGLIFTLLPTGKMRIDYDYKKPEDFEDSEI